MIVMLDLYSQIGLIKPLTESRDALMHARTRGIEPPESHAVVQSQSDRTVICDSIMTVHLVCHDSDCHDLVN